jgi:ClpP class serine protease
MSIDKSQMGVIVPMDLLVDLLAMAKPKTPEDREVIIAVRDRIKETERQFASMVAIPRVTSAKGLDTPL